MKRLASISQPDIVLHIADKKKEKTKKNQALDLCYFTGQSYFRHDTSKHYLGFQLFFKSFTTPSGSDRILSWKSKGLLEGNIKYSLIQKSTFIRNAKIVVEGN